MNLQYKSFYWCLGTTSFRTKNFNKRIEQQLALLRDFWTKHVGEDWSGNDELQAAYYDFLHEVGFLTGNASNKPKDAREKTSGLVSLGLIDDGRKLTEAGNELLTLSEKNNFTVNNLIGIPADSFIYFKQLLKTSLTVDENIVRPFCVTAYLLAKLGKLSYEEFAFLLPLAIDKATTLQTLENIRAIRRNTLTVDAAIFNRILDRENYKLALNHFLNAQVVTIDIIAQVGINRKSHRYDKAYFPVYSALRRFYLEKDKAALEDVVVALKALSNTGNLWQKFLFGNANATQIRNLPAKYLRPNLFDGANTESKFRYTFFAVMHVLKVKRSLADYFDLNRRYMKTSDVIIFADGTVTLDVIPRHYFSTIDDELLNIAFKTSPHLKRNCNLSQIALFLKPKEFSILNGINQEFNLDLKSLQDASELLERQRYLRLNHLIDSKFTNEKILHILNLIATRKDDETQKLVTDNADIPTIFEYVLGILWYKVSHRQGKILDFMKLSLDVNLLPKTHAAGGDADIVYEYPQSATYPEHSLLLEATLTDRTNQRRMEMEPVSRHLGNHILRTHNPSSYCVFATNELNINVVSDFRGKKYQRYYDMTDDNNFIDGMKIIPLQIDDLKSILEKRISYEELYQIFEIAFQSDLAPREWRNTFIVSPIQCS